MPRACLPTLLVSLALTGCASTPRRHAQTLARPHEWDTQIADIPTRAELRRYRGSYRHACGVRRDGALACWHLGSPRATIRRRPGAEILAFAATPTSGCVIDSTGKVVCWDDGLLDPGDIMAPHRIAGLDEHGRLPVQLDHLHARGCAVLSSGRVACWGRAHDGCHDEAAGSYFEARFVPGVRDVTAVALANDFTCTLGHAGEVRCWGDAWVPAPDGVVRSQVCVAPGAPPTLFGGIQLAASAAAACLRDRHGGVRCWDALHPHGPRACRLALPGLARDVEVDEFDVWVTLTDGRIFNGPAFDFCDEPRMHAVTGPGPLYGPTWRGEPPARRQPVPR